MWNIVATAKEGRYREARDILGEFGRVADTDYFNVLTVEVAEPEAFPKKISRLFRADPPSRDYFGHLSPVSQTFQFQTPEMFERHAREAVTDWLDLLGGSRFFVRMHRRGFKGRLSSQEEERFLDAFVIKSLTEMHQPPRVDFSDPDYVVLIETVSQQAGLSLWGRDDKRAYDFLPLD